MYRASDSHHVFVDGRVTEQGGGFILNTLRRKTVPTVESIEVLQLMLEVSRLPTTALASERV
jgi:hypothetical protein